MEDTKFNIPEFIILDKHGNEKVKASLLAAFVRKHLNYLLVRNSGKNDKQIYVYVDGVYKLTAPETFKGMIKEFIENYDEELVSMPVINETFGLLSTDLAYIRIEELDADERIINFQNGLLLVTEDDLKLYKHSPDVPSTIQIPCNWAEETPTPVFDSYLETLTRGNKEVANLLMQFIGVVISNVKGYRMKKSLFMVGPGDTGKSQLKSLCEKLIGHDNFSSCDFNDLEARFGTSDLYCKRLAGSADASHMSVKELKTFKKLTGGDSIRAEFKGQKAFDFTYNGLLWLCMNSLPKFGGDNGPWVYERIMVVLCDNVIPKDKQDKTLLDKMYAEREGIIRKAVTALQQVIRNGFRFDEPPCVKVMREDYMNENSSVFSFFTDCVTPRPNGKICDSCTTGKMFKVYRSWCRNNNHGFAETEKDFRAKISKLMGGAFSDVMRTDLTSAPNGTKLGGPNGTKFNSGDELAKENKSSHTNIYRYIALTKLLPDLQNAVDGDLMKMTAGVEIAKLDEDSQWVILRCGGELGRFPTPKEATDIREKFENGCEITKDLVRDIFLGKETKRVITLDAKLFPEGLTQQEREEYLLCALKVYKKELERQKRSGEEAR